MERCKGDLEMERSGGEIDHVMRIRIPARKRSERNWLEEKIRFKDQLG